MSYNLYTSSLALLTLQDYSKSIGDETDTLQELLDRPVDRIHEYMDLLKVMMREYEPNSFRAA